LPAGRDAKAALKRIFKGAVRLAAPLNRRHPRTRILTYHNVGLSKHEMNVTPSDFGAQMEWLKKNHSVIRLDQVPTQSEGIAITFDDGYRDNLVNAAPILHALGLPATVFMVAGLAGKLLRDDDSGDAARLMTWDELREIESLGISIGSHTVTHCRLASVDAHRQRAEIVESKQILEETLGRPVAAFAYPYGSALDYTADTRQIVIDAGYTLAVSNQYGPNAPGADLWTLRRIWIDETDTLASFRGKTGGELDALRWLDSPLGIRGRRMLNHLIGND